jgi:outer membrane lipoprotein SlyB
MAMYNSDVLDQFADDLNSRADQAVPISAFLGALLGAIVGAAASGGSDNLPMFAGIGALVLAIIGGFLGRAKAFQLRVQAQTLLCQVQIEENTRRAASAVPEAPLVRFGKGVRPPRLSPDA